MATIPFRMLARPGSTEMHVFDVDVDDTPADWFRERRKADLDQICRLTIHATYDTEDQANAALGILGLDAATVAAFIEAHVLHCRALKAQVDAAADVAAIDAIEWSAPALVGA